MVTLVTQLAHFNRFVLRIGRGIGAFAMAVMVLAILIQVVFRYGFNNALPWPDEAARFCMLWLTGLMAPTAFRRGGFVAIDMFGRMLPSNAAQVLNILLLGLSLLVLIVAVQIGWNEVTGFGGRFKTAALYLPTSFGFDTWYRIPRSWMVASLFVGVVLLISVNIELILRAFLTLIGRAEKLPEITLNTAPGAE
jgi:TRAP-type C4-dicarboxylate transport system permease small subunit